MDTSSIHCIRIHFESLRIHWFFIAMRKVWKLFITVLAIVIVAGFGLAIYAFVSKRNATHTVMNATALQLQVGHTNSDRSFQLRNATVQFNSFQETYVVNWTSQSIFRIEDGTIWFVDWSNHWCRPIPFDPVASFALFSAGTPIAVDERIVSNVQTSPNRMITIPSFCNQQTLWSQWSRTIAFDTLSQFLAPLNAFDDFTVTERINAVPYGPCCGGNWLRCTDGVSPSPNGIQPLCAQFATCPSNRTCASAFVSALQQPACNGDVYCLAAATMYASVIGSQKELVIGPVLQLFDGRFQSVFKTVNIRY